ncbi:MAG: hypothetical protein SOH93_01875 [Oscillospiraceae bacterium]|jgi:type I restriction enzyme S subunit
MAVGASSSSSNIGFSQVECEDIVFETGQLNKDVYTKEIKKAGIKFYKGNVLYGKLRPYLQKWLSPSFSGLAVGDFLGVAIPKPV